jgi:hypothetical protein
MRHGCRAKRLGTKPISSTKSDPHAGQGQNVCNHHLTQKSSVRAICYSMLLNSTVRVQFRDPAGCVCYRLGTTSVEKRRGAGGSPPACSPTKPPAGPFIAVSAQIGIILGNNGHVHWLTFNDNHGHKDVPDSAEAHVQCVNVVE